MALTKDQIKALLASGDAADVIENIEAQRDDALGRIAGFDHKFEDAQATAQAALVQAAEHAKDLTDAHTAELADKDAQRQALADAHAQELAAKDATIANQRSLIDALGGTDLGQQMKRDAAIAEANKKKEAAEAELAKLLKSDAADDAAVEVGAINQ